MCKWSMAPRPLQQTGPPSFTAGLHGSEEEGFSECEADAIQDFHLDDEEPIALQVFRGRRRLLETILEMDTTVRDLKVQVERTTGIPGSCQIIASNGRPLCNSLVLRTCLNHIISAVTVREADESWVQALEALGETGESTELIATLPARCDAAFRAAHSKMEQIRITAADTAAHYKRATAKVVASANGLEDAAEHLQRNRAVVFEVIPRGSKGARRAAEDLMQCRSALLSATQANGLVLNGWSATSSTMQPVIEAFNAELIELRAALRQSNELLQQRCDLLQLQRFSGRLGNGDVEQHLQQCQEELARLEADDLERACQELVAARRNYKLAMKSNLLAIKRASEYLQQDERVVLSWALNHVSKGRTLDRDFMLTVVQSNGEALEEAAPQLRQDREVVLEALRSSKGWALQFAAEELKRDRDIVLTAVRRSGLCLEFAAAEMRADRDVVLAAVQVHGEALEFASQELRRDEVVVAAAIQTSRGWALQYASEELRRNRKMVLGALHENGLMLEHASQDLRGDAEIAMVAVTSNPSALQFASEKLRNSKKIVLAAVSKDGFALQFASSSMKADREVVAAAVKQAGEYVLMIADPSMQSDSQISDLVKKYGGSQLDGPFFSEGFVEVSWTETGFGKTNL